MARPAARSYHHGDLRNACLAEGQRLLAREGPRALSLRAIARGVRVSPRAPYRHFADRDALLAALCEEGFARFGAALRRALAGRDGAPPVERLERLADAYVRFFEKEPHLAELMFGDDLPQRARRFPSLDRAALATFAGLEGEIALLIPGGSPRERALAATAAWAAVHGLADLQRHAQLQHVLRDQRDRRRVGRFVVDLFVRGLSARVASKAR